jgi:hypothetical protein
MGKFVKQQICKTSIQGAIAFAMEFLEIGNRYLQIKCHFEY